MNEVEKNHVPFLVKKLLLIPIIALGLASCSSTVQSRIEKNPELYEALPTSQKELVTRGEIKRGMAKEAVFLAWGKPDNVGNGENSKGRFERWTYNTLEPVYTHRFHGYYGRRYRGYYGGRCYRGYGFYPGYGADVLYVPRRSAQVDFRNGRVSDWKNGLNTTTRTPLY